MARPKPEEKMKIVSIYLPERLVDALDRITENKSKFIGSLLEESINTL
jgi:metal-responsive CopG/Arc/MetJ family transcriptional regulator